MYNEKSLALYIKLFGDNNEDVVKSFHNIGITYSQSGDHNHSLEYNQKSLAIQNKLFGGTMLM
jgi:tetratricopeptide (TPR) repeat protein